MDVLVGHAAESGPAGHSARTALSDIYTQDIGPEKRRAILNAAQAISQRMRMALGEGVDNLSVTVAFLGACAPLPPLGENGPGHVDANLTHVARNLPPELQGKSDLLAENRAITGAELLAAGADLENLNVRDKPISMATPSVAEEFVNLGHQALRQQTSVTAWVPGSSGHHVAVVAEPATSGIRFLVIARPGDEQGPEVENVLKDLSFGGPCVVSRYAVERPHIALEHLNDNIHDARGAGAVIQEHADHWSSLSLEDRLAVNQASQAKLFESLAASGAQTPAADVPQRPEPAIVVNLPADTVVPRAAGAVQKPPTVTSSAVPEQALAAKIDTNPPIKNPSREQMSELALKAGFFKDQVGQTTNVWADMARTVNTHDTAKGVAGPLGDKAGYLERWKLSKEVDSRLNKMPESDRGLATAVMNAGPVPTTLAKSPLWAHLNKVRISTGSNQEPLLKGTGQGVVVLTAQLIVRMKMLSEEVIKHAPYVTSNDPTNPRNIYFRKVLQELQDYMQSSGEKLNVALTELKSVMDTGDKGVSSRMKADATTLWTALEALRVQFQDPAGTAQQLVRFTKTGLGSEDSLQLAADAVTL